MDTTASRGVRRLDNPNISARIARLELLIVAKELSILVGQDVGVRHKVKGIPTKLLLHLYVVEAQTIFPCDLVRVREMVESLEFVQTLVEISFAATTSPEHVPLMRLGVVEAIGFAQAPNQFSVSFQDLIQQLTVVDVVTF